MQTCLAWSFDQFGMGHQIGFLTFTPFPYGRSLCAYLGNKSWFCGITVSNTVGIAQGISNVLNRFQYAVPKVGTVQMFTNLNNITTISNELFKLTFFPVTLLF